MRTVTPGPLVRVNMAAAVVDHVLLVVHGPAAPTEDDWTRYLALVQSHGVEGTVCLIVTAGGQPTPAQRRQLDELRAGRAVPVALLTDIARMRVQAVPAQGIRAFRLDEMSLALAALRVPIRQWEHLRTALADLRRALDEAP
jgi:hypothetical protein